MLEVLQVLKYIYKQDELDFTSDWIAKDADYTIDRATEAAINELVSAGKVEELRDLLNNMEGDHS